MIKYHGTPITPKSIFETHMIDRNALISFADTRDLKRALTICDKIIIDNGAFSIWRKGGEVDWDDFYKFLEPLHDKIEFFFIPDVIDGTELENDNLITDYLYREYHSRQIINGVPIWHLNESLERLNRLTKQFDYIAFGSSGEYSDLRTVEWANRIHQAMKVVCDEYGVPKVKIHMLRCLNHRIFTKYPFYSGDSTHLAQNHKTMGVSKILRNIHNYDSPEYYAPIRENLFK